jgi:6-phosphogluconolactonase
VIREFPDPVSLAEALAGYVAAVLSARLAQAGTAVLAVSGGSTPVRFFHVLSKKTLDWSNVTVTLVDERWVPETSSRSNATLVRTHLLQGKAATARFLPLYNGAATPDAGCAAFGLPLPLTVAVLGMGTDGHTASLFPGGDNLASALDLDGEAIVLPMRAPGAGEPRITLTLPALLGADHIVLHVESEPKRAVLNRAMRPGPVEELPVRAILARQPEPEIFWSP